MQRTLTLFLFALFANSTAPASESLLREALAANPELAASYEAYQAASRRGVQVRALDEPMLTYSEFLSSVQTRTGPQERIFALSQSLPWPGVLKLRQDIADTEARAAFFRYEVKRREIIEKVGLALMEYAYLKRATDQAAENLELLRQIKPVVEEKVRGGGSLGSSLRLDVEIAVAEQEVASLRKQRPGLDAQLKAALGRQPDSTMLDWPVLPPAAPALMPLDRVKAEVLSQHPALRQAEAGQEGARQSEVLAEKSNRPSFNVGANAIDIGNGGDTATSVMVGVKLPIRREKYRAEREEAAAMTRAADATREATEQALLARAITLYAAQQEATDRLHNYSGQLIPSASQAVALTQEDFRNDKANLTDLIESERVLLDLNLMHARALADAHKAAWQIRALTEALHSPSK